ncbi:copper-translocating P-type ATPase [Candidatus Endolissoclinum faulkneri L5]|uniref:Copper-translocating P-type ATPase n=1 Tax=Candidatus Endolissoclinum faulkneri L5 TaxID=1401328 RepID=V9TVH2_9PROT|nr:heavy metal translocating P-type ATPase [Candidatus Endolissoclinum faulkneri]AHC73673.1 copper-translocating P-type ATPase [Candidatus Endolissoclinum faulkneri L5]
MSCCISSAPFSLSDAQRPSKCEIINASQDIGNGVIVTRLAIPEAHCAACIATIEKAISMVEGVIDVRVNLAERFVTVKWPSASINPDAIFNALDRAGYRANLLEEIEITPDPILRRLLLALAIAGFASGNIMLLSVSIWSGANDATRDLFHWISACIAIPTIIISGRPFFASALKAVVAKHLNMDVPISLAVILATGLSLHETLIGGLHTYFDASVTLLFFLLIGQTLNHMLRSRAGSALRTLDRTTPTGASVISSDGTITWTPLSRVVPGNKVLVSSGDRVPVDGIVIDGSSRVDLTIVTGESEAINISIGDTVTAGAVVLDSSLTLSAIRIGQASFLGEMRSMLELAENNRPAISNLADKAAALYAPAVHLIAVATFIGWWIVGKEFSQSLSTAITVLIITCPCALGLAAPIVQVIAAEVLLKYRILLREGNALEILANIDQIIIDKTGTITIPTIDNCCMKNFSKVALSVASTLARESHHPISKAIADSIGLTTSVAIDHFSEHIGKGLEGMIDSQIWRLGKPNWALSDKAFFKYFSIDRRNASVLSCNGNLMGVFNMVDLPRPGADIAIAKMISLGLSPTLLSGDSEDRVANVARRIGITTWSSKATPDNKVNVIKMLQNKGHHVLMIGDGLNDAPAMAAADVSIAPGNASDVSRTVAEIIFLGKDMNAVVTAIMIARKAKQIMVQNLLFAFSYNAIAIPLAIACYATPLVAAIAMSASSIIVIANALRLIIR